MNQADRVLSTPPAKHVCT